MITQKRIWSSTSLLDLSMYSRFTKEDVKAPTEKVDFFPTNPLFEDSYPGSKFIISPENTTKILWDICGFFIILYQAIFIPFYIAFSINLSTSSIFTVDFGIMIYFTIDILLNFNTSYYSHAELINDRKAIVKNYIKFWFWIDLISTFPYDVVYNVIEIRSHSFSYAPQLLRVLKFYRLLRLIRLAKMKKIFIQIEEYIDSEAIINFLIVLRLFVFAFFITHWIACLWYYVSLMESEYYAYTWLSVAYFETGSTAEVYVTSLYWAFTTMATVGYGDIVPITKNEMIFALVALLVSCGMFAYTVGSIGVLVSKYTQDEREYREKTVSINAFMKRRKIPIELRFRTRRYLEYTWEQYKLKTLGEGEIIELLSEPLREEIFVYTRGAVLHSCSIIHKYSSHFIQQLSKLLEVNTFAPSDIIFEEGEKSAGMYFIRNGEVELFQSSTGTLLKLLKSGKHCGEIALFCETPRCCSARSVDFLECLILEKKSLDMLFAKNPDALRLFEYTKNQCRKGDLSALDIRCYLCTEIGHVATRCTKFHLNVNNDYLKNKWIRSRNQATRLINPYDEPKNNFTKKKRKADLRKYNSSNVIGTEYGNRTVKCSKNLAQKISSFYDFDDSTNILDNQEIIKMTQSSFMRNARSSPGLSCDSLDALAVLNSK
ncbi:hypothetical protein SteCoe_18155 [Stentor coeruleus]|uniref:Cyclic nucleotide-binding domain-containing protein n=1 Tax=Stentor coeruleus TaxID=5963 RepID=A0A1R2BXC8_9CILI|nr:hypothetical protein SteCoe_18155 [Stentor coeruleus]